MRVKIILMIMLAKITTMTSCSAKESSDKSSTKPVLAKDTIMQKALGDSIYRVIT